MTKEQRRRCASILTFARKRVAKGWTQGVLARDETGKEVRPSSPKAVCWCMSGALNAVKPYSKGEPATRNAVSNILNSITRPANGYVSWNDAPQRTQEEVLHIFDRAIDMLRNKEPTT